MPRKGEPFHARILALVLLVSFVPMSACRAVPPRARAGLELDLIAPGQRARATHDLLSDDAAVWREAQLRLASAGPAGLQALEQRSLLISDRGKRRAVEVIRLSLLLSVPWREVQTHPMLLALIADSLDRGAEVVASLPLRSLDEQGLSPVEEAEPAPPIAIDLVNRIGGFAVPALLARLRDERPEERAATCVLLRSMRAVSQVASVETLVTERAQFHLWHGDYESLDSVSTFAREASMQMRAMTTDRYRFELPIHALASSWTLGPDDMGLLDDLRQAAGRSDAHSWNEWWNAARPAWRDWWAHH